MRRERAMERGREKKRERQEARRREEMQKEIRSNTVEPGPEKPGRQVLLRT